MDWQGQHVAKDEHGLPAPLRWRPVFMWRALVFGFLFDLAAEVLLQQLGKQILTVYSFFHAAIVGTIVGIVAPSLGRLVGVWWANRHIKAARQHVAEANPTEEATP